MYADCSEASRTVNVDCGNYDVQRAVWYHITQLDVEPISLKKKQTIDIIIQIMNLSPFQIYYQTLNWTPLHETIVVR